MTGAYKTFYRELRHNFLEVGSFCPSSPDLARIMVEPLGELSGAKKILEVGPGTGPITREILKRMGPADHLTICEINPNLLQRLRLSLSHNEYFRRHQSRVTFVEGPAQQLPVLVPSTQFDVIICSLPFSNFEADTTEDIMRSLHNMLSCRGHLSFFEYWGVRRLAVYFSTPKNRARLKAVDSIIRKWKSDACEKGEVRIKLSFLNLPPAKAIQFKYSN